VAYWLSGLSISGCCSTPPSQKNNTYNLLEINRKLAWLKEELVGAVVTLKHQLVDFRIIMPKLVVYIYNKKENEH
jgi:hypothetical protein